MDERSAEPRRVTLAELGQRLPYGRKLGSEHRADYVMREPSVQLDIDIYDAKTSESVRGFPGKAVSETLRLMLLDVCGKVIPEMGKEDSTLLVSHLSVPDVLTMLYARIFQRRPMLYTTGPMKCSCGSVVPAGSPLSVGQMLVEIHEPWTDPPTKVVEFDEPVVIKDLGGEIRQLTLGVPTWLASHGDLTDKQFSNDAYRRAATVEAAIIGSDLNPVERFKRPKRGYLFLTHPDILDRLLMEVIRLQRGPIPAIPATCPGCKTEILVPFSWREVPIT